MAAAILVWKAVWAMVAARARCAFLAGAHTQCRLAAILASSR
jgi:hypothetical protein